MRRNASTPRAPAALLSADALGALRRFVASSRFATDGGIVTDLDGTAVHEREGRTVIAEPVESGLKALAERGCPVVINSLRFPLSVIRTFGREWYAVTGAPVPTVALNGSQIGRIVADASHALAFEEIDAFPLSADDIDEVLEGVRGLLDARIDDVLLFYYPRDWSEGEAVWTPLAARTASVADKYASASRIVASGVDALADRLHAEDICMMMLLVDVPQDRRMAYQHTKRSSFFTRRNVDKLHGARAIARQVGIDLDASVGAGDTELDTFLAGVGLSIIVGNAELDFKGNAETLRLDDSLALGALFFELASLIDDSGRPRRIAASP